jgi:hypothetical protein
MPFKCEVCAITISPIFIQVPARHRPLPAYIYNLNHNPFPFSSHLLPSYSFASFLALNPIHLLYPLKHSGFTTVLLTLISLPLIICFTAVSAFFP